MASDPAIVGVSQPDQTAFAKVRELCDKNGCDPMFRAETIDGRVYFSMQALRRSDGRRMYDIRQDASWDDASRDAEKMAGQALAEWWA